MPSDYAESFLALRHMLRQGSGWSGHEKNCVFLNTGTKRFADISATSGLNFDDDARAVAMVDWDGDGDLDLWLSNRTGPRVRFMRNDLPGNPGFVALRLEGSRSNRDAVGARVELVSEGKRLLRTVHAGEGFLGQSSKWLHFGLGRDRHIESVRVFWPDGTREDVGGVEAGGFFHVLQGTGRARAGHGPRRSVQLQARSPQPPPKSTMVRVVLDSPVPAPAMEFTDFEGEKRSVDFESPVTLVNLWATWCKPCGKELRELASHADALRAEGLEVVALSLDGLGADRTGSPEAARQFLEDLRFPFTTGMAAAATVNRIELLHGALIHTLRPFPIPSSLLVDADGWVVAIYQGAVNVEQLREDAKALSHPTRPRRELAVPFAGRWAWPPRFFTYMNDMGLEYLDAGYPGFAAQHYEKLLERFGDDNVQWLTYLGMARSQEGHIEEAIEPLRQAVQRAPQQAEPARMLAWLLATSPASAAAEIDEALRLARHANELTRRGDAATLDALAAAEARAGNYEAAENTARAALGRAEATEQESLVEQIQRRQSLYAHKQAYVVETTPSIP